MDEALKDAQCFQGDLCARPRFFGTTVFCWRRWWGCFFSGRGALLSWLGLLSMKDLHGLRWELDHVLHALTVVMSRFFLIDHIPLMLGKIQENGEWCRDSPKGCGFLDWGSPSNEAVHRASPDFCLQPLWQTGLETPWLFSSPVGSRHKWQL